MKRVVKVVGTLGLMGCAVIVSPFAVAGDSGWYTGTNIGQSRAKVDDARITTQLVGVGSASIIDDNRDTAYKLFGGYQINKYFALEAGYFDLGQFGYTAAAPAGTLIGNIRLKGINLDAVGILPLTEKFSTFGRVGLNYAETKDNFSNTGAVPAPTNPNPSTRDTNYKVGLGLQYAFTESLRMRVEAERYRINDAVGNKGNIDLISVGLVYRFGEKSPVPAPVQKVVALEPVALEPKVVVVTVTPPPPPPAIVTPPPPPPLLPPPPPAPKKIIFSADSSVDSLFDFGKATIKQGGQQALDKFAADLKGANFNVITVTGHTDRIGSRKFNEKLSEHRAEVVKNYLMEAGGIPVDKITAKGVGESDPVTKLGECASEKGAKVTKDLIDCLQPDRRVEVEVIATRTSK